MNRKYIFVLAVILAGIITFFLVRKPEYEYKKIEGQIQGTTYHITYEYKEKKDLHEKIREVLHDFDLALSAYMPGSILSKVNRNDPDVKLNELFEVVFNKSKEIFLATDGSFDITVAPLVNAWGFGSQTPAEADSAFIDSLMQYVGMEKVKLERGKIIKQNPGITLDMNAIAQGYSVDVVAAFLDRYKVKNYLVEIGGELKSKGVNAKGNEWRIGIDKPIEGNMDVGKNLQAIVSVQGKSLATSGNYRKFYEKNGIKYVHTIDPHTGYPVLSRLLSATILADDCITADAYATAMMVMGIDKGVEFLSKHNELDAYLVYSDKQGNFRTYLTSGMETHILQEF